MHPPKGTVDQTFYDFIVSNGYTQCVEEPTRQNHIIDLVITNEPFLISTMNVDMPFSNSDHNTVRFDIFIEHSNIDTCSPCRIKKFLWKNGDYDAMSDYFSNYNWSAMFTVCLTADDLWNGFIDVLNHAIDMFVPFKLVSEQRSQNKHKRYPRHIRNLLARKQCLWRVLRQDKDNLDLRMRYHCLAKECKQAITNYEINIESKVIESRNTGTFYKYVNQKLANKHSVGLLFDDSGRPVINDSEKASLLNDYFSTVNITDDGNLPPLLSKAGSNSLDNIEFTPDMLIRLCKNIKPKLTSDPDNYSPYLLKHVIHALSFPLSHIFNSLMSVGKIPSAWKKAIVTPIFKKGQSSNPANYRPISLTSIFSKLMERGVVHNMLDYLRTSNLLNKHQHGFLAKKSTITNLLESVNDWTLSVENSNDIVIAYIDFTRAFDSVSHEKLVHKLKAYGIAGELLKWVTNFLSDRIQCTKVGGCYSPYKPIRSGVIQGSCLGPLLFLIYINDVVELFSDLVTPKLYADDVKLYTTIRSNVDCINFQHNLNKLYEWTLLWQLQISFSKCYIIHIGRYHSLNNVVKYKLGDVALKTVDIVSDLGVNVDCKLNFCEHIANITRKAHARANLILRCFISGHRMSIINAFKVYVRPLLEYNSSVWSPSLKKLIELLERVQRRFTKRIFGLYNLTYHQRLICLGLESLELRRLRADLLLVYKIVFGLTGLRSENFFRINVSRNIRNLRGHPYQLVHDVAKKSVRNTFFVNRIVGIWNNLHLDPSVFNCFNQFKRSLTTEILAPFCKVNFN